MDNNMTVTTRITTIRLLELMKKQPEYAKEMGLRDTSHFRKEESTACKDRVESPGRTQ